MKRIERKFLSKKMCTSSFRFSIILLTFLELIVSGTILFNVQEFRKVISNQEVVSRLERFNLLRST